MGQNKNRAENEDDNGIFYHPATGQPIYGRLLEEGEILQEDDVYASSCGAWLEAPCPGQKIDVNSLDVLWLRPAPTVTGVDGEVPQFVSPTAGRAR